MKWLQDNFVGMALLAGIATLLLVSLTLAVVWAWPVSGEVPETAIEDAETSGPMAVVSAIGPMEDYQIINERPLFNVSRAPEVTDENSPEVVVEDSMANNDAPDVKLTGIFISPSVRIASLMPVSGEQISVTAKEGEPLIGDYVGWHVSQVRPRHVVLESRDGQTLKLDLKIHDSVIAEPPKMQLPTPAEAALTEADENAVPVGEDGQPLSRAEQIRARIAERREELRRQQQGAESDDPAQQGGEKKAAPPPDYQSAIRAMMNNRNKDKNSNDKDDS